MRLGILLFTLLVYGVFKLCRGQLPFDSSGVAQLFAGGENESSENDASLLSNVALGLQKQGKSLADDIKFALRFTDLWKTSTFPTSVASNIDSKCLNDSIIYYYAYILELDWANKSNVLKLNQSNNTSCTVTSLHRLLQCTNRPVNSPKGYTEAGIHMHLGCLTNVYQSM